MTLDQQKSIHAGWLQQLINMDIPLEKLRLAIDGGEFKLVSRADNYQRFQQMLQQSNRNVDIFSLQLDHKLYDTAEISSQLQSLIRHNPHSHIRLLLRNPRHLVTNGHRIIELSRRLSSFIEIRQLAEIWHEHLQAFSLFDKHGIIYRPNSEQFEGWFSFNASVRVISERKFFNEAWNTSLPCNETRRLYL